MKVIYLVDSPLEKRGGAQVSTLSAAKELIKKYGISTYIITPGYKNIPDLFDTGEVNILRLKECNDRLPSPINNILEFLKVKSEIENIIAEVKPDIVHSQMPLSFIYNALLKTKSIKIHTDRGLYYGYSKKSKLMYWVLKSKIDKIITTTLYNYNLWPISTTKKVCIYNTISEQFEKYDKEKSTLDKKKYNISLDTIVIGFSGRYTDFKNWPFILNLIEKLVENNIKFYLFISFGISDNDKEEVKELEEFISKIYKIKPNDLTIFKNLNQKQMSDFYYPIDIFIIPSNFESFGKVAVEAMSRYCCVLASNKGGLPEVIGDKSCVFELDLELFYVKIVELIQNKNKLENCKQKSFERYLNNFISDYNTRGHYELYTDLVNN